MTTSAPEKLADGAALERITDPKERLQRAADTARAAAERAEPHRLRRNAAAVLIFQRAEQAGKPVAPVVLWRHTIAISRTIWHKVMEEADRAQIPAMQAELAELRERIAALTAGEVASLPQLDSEAGKLQRKIERFQLLADAIDAMEAELAADPELDLRAVASAEAKEVRRLERVQTEAQEVRNATARDLMDGRYRALYAKVTNSDVAKLAGITTARAAQLRTGPYKTGTRG